MSNYVRVIRILDRDQAIQGLASLREDWQAVAEQEGKSLLELQSSVGLLLDDMAKMIGLYPEEQAQALGDGLYQEIQSLEEQPVSLTEEALSLIPAE